MTSEEANKGYTAKDDETIAKVNLNNSNLLTGNILNDELSNSDKIFDKPLPESYHEPQSPGTREAPAWKIALLPLEEDGPSLGLLVNRSAVMGRGSANNNEPYFSLESFDAFKKGVSRRHVLLEPKQDQLLLIDLASTNGTKLNGERLNPGEPVMLSDGAVLAVGRMVLGVRIIEKPESA